MKALICALLFSALILAFACHAPEIADKASVTNVPTKETENNSTDSERIIVKGEYNNKDKDGYLNMRRRPQPDAEIIGIIPEGEQFTILDTAFGDWSKIVRGNNDTGFVWSNRIRVLSGNNTSGKTYNNLAEYLRNMYNYLPDSFNCDFEKLLSDPSTPGYAKKLYHNTAELTSDSWDEPLDYFYHLKSNSKQERAFYFRVLTNTHTISDGALSEGLCASGKGFIEYCPQEFASYFENKDCFTEKDLKVWVDYARLELSLELDGYDQSVYSEYIRNMKSNCKDCSPTQIEIIDKFSLMLKKRWKDQDKSD